MREQTGWLQRVARNDLLAFGFFVGLSLVLRTQVFSASVVDMDESLYFLIAKDLRAGFMPYETIFEHKPVGTFIIFGLFQTLLGDRVIAIRIATILAVAISALLIKAITDLLVSATLEEDSARSESTASSGPIARWAPGLVAGSLFAVYSTTNGGLAANTEHFFIPFVCGAFLLIMKLVVDPSVARGGARGAWYLVGAGLLMGLALQVKYLVAWEAILLGLVILSLGYFHGAPASGRTVSKRSLAAVFLYAIGVIAPSALVVAVFWSRGMWDAWLYANITANIAYGRLAGFAAGAWMDAIAAQAASQSVLWAAALLTLAFVTRGPGSRPIKAAGLLLFLWWIAGLAGASSTRLFFEHYFLQPLAPACIMSAWLVLVILPRTLKWPAGGGSLRLARWGLVTLVFAQAIGLTGEALLKSAKAIDGRVRGGDAWPNGEPTRVAASIRDEIRSGDEIYVVDYELIVYHLAGARWPTRYIFPTQLPMPRGYTLDVHPLDELERIIARDPLFIVKQRRSSGSPEFFAALQAAIERDYVMHDSIGQVNIYRRRADR